MRPVLKLRGGAPTLSNQETVETRVAGTTNSCAAIAIVTDTVLVRQRAASHPPPLGLCWFCARGLPSCVHSWQQCTSEGVANAKSNHAFNAVLRERSRLQSFDHSSFFEMLERLAPSARYHLCTSFCPPAHLCVLCFSPSCSSSF